MYAFIHPATECIQAKHYQIFQQKHGTNKRLHILAPTSSNTVLQPPYPITELDHIWLAKTHFSHPSQLASSCSSHIAWSLLSLSQGVDKLPKLGTSFLLRCKFCIKVASTSSLTLMLDPHMLKKTGLLVRLASTSATILVKGKLLCILWRLRDLFHLSLAVQATSMVIILWETFTTRIEDKLVISLDLIPFMYVASNVEA